MKILLVHTEDTASFPEHQFVLYLKRILTGGNHKVTVYSDDLPDQAVYNLIIIVGNGIACMQKIRSKVRENIPAVFFVATARENVHIPVLKNICRVFYIDSFPVEYVDFPKELSMVIHFPGLVLLNERKSRVAPSPNRTIAFIGDHAVLYPSKQVITVFNELEDCGVWMFVREEYINTLKEYANDNILFRSIDQYPQLLDSIDVVIASGKPAVDAVLNGKPAIVVGHYGFGGLVSMRNIQAHIKQSFSGRIGGTKGERIPVEFIMAELEWTGQLLSEEPAFPGPLAAIVRESFDEERITKIIANHICGVVTLHNNIYENRNGLLSLVPVIAGNVAVQKNSTAGVLRRLGSMRIIMELQEDALLFIGLIDGQRSVAGLLSVLGEDVDTEDILACIRNLWEEKVIYFKQVN